MPSVSHLHRFGHVDLLLPVDDDSASPSSLFEAQNGNFTREAKPDASKPGVIRIPVSDHLLRLVQDLVNAVRYWKSCKPYRPRPSDVFPHRALVDDAPRFVEERKLARENVGLDEAPKNVVHFAREKVAGDYDRHRVAGSNVRAEMQLHDVVNVAYATTAATLVWLIISAHVSSCEIVDLWWLTFPAIAICAKIALCTCAGGRTATVTVGLLDSACAAVSIFLAVVVQNSGCTDPSVKVPEVFTTMAAVAIVVDKLVVTAKNTMETGSEVVT